jgi:glyoxylase-like metal-dependent hydrolase (beta-lactamase superfamily II)
LLTVSRLESHYHHVMTGGGAVATYLITGPDGHAALIDAGAGDAEHLGALADGLQSPGSGLESVFVTHGHIDHVAGAPALHALHPSARFHKHAPLIVSYGEAAQAPGAGLQASRSGLEAPGPAWLPLADLQRIDAAGTALVVLHTPGHAPDHVVFWHEESGTVFAGDLVIAGSSVIIPHSRGGDLLDYLASLERVRALEPRRLLPAHGPEIDDPEAVLVATREHRERREREILAAMVGSPRTVPALVDSIYHGLAPGLARAAQESVRAHLEKLRREGRAVEDNGLWQERS